MFIDADKPNYGNYWDAALPLVPVGGLVLADNTLWSGKVVAPKEASDHAIVAFNAKVKADPRVASGNPKDPGPKDDGKGKGGTGTVRVGAKGGFCNVSVNGAALGPTPTQTTVPAGTARVTCTPEGGSPMTQSVQVEAGGTARVGFVIP